MVTPVSTETGKIAVAPVHVHSIRKLSSAALTVLLLAALVKVFLLFVAVGS